MKYYLRDKIQKNEYLVHASKIYSMLYVYFSVSPLPYDACLAQKAPKQQGREHRFFKHNKIKNGTRLKLSGLTTIRFDNNFVDDMSFKKQNTPAILHNQTDRQHQQAFNFEELDDFEDKGQVILQLSKTPIRQILSFGMEEENESQFFKTKSERSLQSTQITTSDEEVEKEQLPLIQLNKCLEKRQKISLDLKKDIWEKMRNHPRLNILKVRCSDQRYKILDHSHERWLPYMWNQLKNKLQNQKDKLIQDFLQTRPPNTPFQMKTFLKILQMSLEAFYSLKRGIHIKLQGRQKKKVNIKNLPLQDILGWLFNKFDQNTNFSKMKAFSRQKEKQNPIPPNMQAYIDYCRDQILKIGAKSFNLVKKFLEWLMQKIISQPEWRVKIAINYAFEPNGLNEYTHPIILEKVMARVNSILCLQDVSKQIQRWKLKREQIFNIDSYIQDEIGWKIKYEKPKRLERQENKQITQIIQKYKKTKTKKIKKSHQKKSQRREIEQKQASQQISDFQLSIQNQMQGQVQEEMEGEVEKENGEISPVLQPEKMQPQLQLCQNNGSESIFFDQSFESDQLPSGSGVIQDYLSLGLILNLSE